MICQICHKDFVPRYSFQKFCSDVCSKKAERLRHRKLRAQNAAKQVNEQSNPKSLDDWCREAAECNLDYGNYRALIESGKTFDELKARADSHQFQTHSHLRAGRKYS